MLSRLYASCVHQIKYFWKLGAISSFAMSDGSVQATEFVVRNNSGQCELARITCGGHRRPFSFTMNPPSFAFIKDKLLHIFPPQHAHPEPLLEESAARDASRIEHQETDGDQAALLKTEMGRMSASSASRGDSSSQQQQSESRAQPGQDASRNQPSTRLMHVPHHGREVHCGLLIPGPPSQNESPYSGECSSVKDHPI